MSDLDRYLLATERAVVDVRRHWVSLSRPAAIFLALFVLSGVLIIGLGDAQLFALIGVGLLFGALGWFSWQVGDWWVEHFVITDKRVLLVTGLLTKRVAIMPLNRVTDLTYERPIVGRVLGYGTFVMESAGQQQALRRIDYLPRPDELYQDVSGLLFGPRATIYSGRGPGAGGYPGGGYPGTGGFGPGTVGDGGLHTTPLPRQ